MRVLLDHNVHSRYASLLPKHDVTHAQKIGWDDLLNGELIEAAEAAHFEVIVTADKNLRYQQNLEGRKISILVLNAKRITWPHIEPLAAKVNAALENLPAGSFVVITPDD